MRMLATAVAGLILALGIYVAIQPVGSLFGAGPDSDPSASATSSGGLGGPAPDFVGADGTSVLLGLDDRPIRMADFAGRPLWIVFWATWCGPCQAEAADIKAIYDAHAGDGLAVLAIDIQEPTAAVTKFVADRGLDYQIGLDPTASTPALYGALGLPSHVFVGRDGMIQVRYAGQMTADLMERHVAAILAR